MRHLAIFLITHCWQFSLLAQPLKPDVVAAAGATLSNVENTARLSFTVGEAVIQGQQLPTFAYGQGFHNGILKTVRVSDQSLAAWNIELWPSPATDWIWLRFSPPTEQELLYASIWNMLGQPLMPDKRLEQRSDNPINVSHLPSGAYWLRLRDRQGRQSALRFIKIH